jgi:uncharacterized protein
MMVIPQTFLSGKLNLEGVLHLPQECGDQLSGVVLCHPHPLYGGEMNNNVVVAVSQNLSERGIAAFRFNFRGVGLSEGVFDDGVGEQDDLRAALTVLAGRAEINPNRLGVMGYSFGGMVALAAGKSYEQVQAIAAVSPVITPGLMQGLVKPAYFICGTNDHVVSTDLLIREAEGMVPAGQVEIIRGIDHFWVGHEADMAGKVAAFFAGTI